MIELTTNRGLTIHLNPSHIVSIHQASDCSRWHGTASIIRTVTGDTHEVREESVEIYRQVREALPNV